MKTPVRIFALSSICLLFISSFASASGPTGSRTVFPLISTVLRDGESRSAEGTLGILLPGAGRGEGRQPVTAGANDTIYVPTQILEKDWDTVNGTWMNTGGTDFVYDAQGRETERTISAGMFDVWTPQVKISRTYDASGRVVRACSQVWNGGMWRYEGRDTIIYNGSGLPVEEVVEIYNGSAWVPYQRYIAEYDGGGRPARMTALAWGGADWVNSWRQTMTYDGGRLAEYVRETWTGVAWGNILRETYAYDANGSLTEEIDQFWLAESWANDKRFTWTRDGDGFLVDEIVEVWNASAWVNYSHTAYANGATGLPEEILEQAWDLVDWADDRLTYLTYDEDRIIEQYTMIFREYSWMNYHLTAYTWQQVVTSPGSTLEIAVKDRWNMVSVPVDVPDHSKAAVFPSAVSNAFAFDAGYAPASALENGRGYWLKFDGDQAVSVTGAMVTADTFDVAAGWNMVGSIGVPVTVASVGSIPGGLVSSNFFGFDNGYSSASTLEPGKGYWVKVAQAGKLVLDGTGNTPVAPRLRMELVGEMPPPPPSEAGESVELPAGYRLDQNYPNPFNPATILRYALPADGHVTLRIFNALGGEVATLVDRHQAAGELEVDFDGSALPAGVYIYRLTAGAFSASGKMLLVK